MSRVRMTVMRKSLLAALQRCRAAKKSPKPILQGVRLEVLEHAVELFATDIDTWSREQIAADVAEGTGLKLPVLPLKSLLSVIRGMKSETVTIEHGEDDQVTVRSDNGISELTGMPAEEFPPVPTDFTKSVIDISPAAFAAAARRAMSHAARENTRYAISGVQLETRDGKIRFVATDDRRLIIVPLHCPPKIPEGAWIFSLPHLTAAVTAADKSKAAEMSIEICTDTTNAVIRIDSCEFGGVLVEGRFPKYDQGIIPDMNDDAAWRFDREGAIAAVRSIKEAWMNENKDLGVAIECNGTGYTTFSCNNGLASLSANAHAVHVRGLKTTAIRFGINPEYLIEGLEAFDCDTVRVQMTELGKPMLITSCDCDADDATVVIMQINLDEAPAKPVSSEHDAKGTTGSYPDMTPVAAVEVVEEPAADPVERDHHGRPVTTNDQPAPESAPVEICSHCHGEGKFPECARCHRSVAKTFPRIAETPADEPSSAEEVKSVNVAVVAQSPAVTAPRILTAKKETNCYRCGGTIYKGAEINYIRSAKAYAHPGC